MVKKLSRKAIDKKAWVTRRKNAKIRTTLRIRRPSEFKVTDHNILKVSENENPFTPAQPLTLCGQLEDAILLLETRISNAIAKINSLM